MSGNATGPAGIGPESTDDTSSGALSEQQRTWVREVAETLKQRHPQDEPRPAPDAATGDRTTPAGGATS